MNQPILLTFIFYLIAILFIGYLAYRATRNLSDYILGGRRLGPMVTALSAGASDMSGWLLLGLPGAVYASGLSEIWIVLGLVVGAYFNWRFLAVRLRIYTGMTKTLTLPDYLMHRFEDNKNILKIVAAIIILLFFTFYTASGLVAGAKLFATTFNMDYKVALWLGASAIIAYTFFGGFLAVCWTDLIQGLLMLGALVAVPLMISYEFGGSKELYNAILKVKPEAVNWSSGLTLMGFFSLMAWGLGYFGQPHILARFMAIKSPDKLSKARFIGMSWMIITLIAACAVGLGGIGFFAARDEAQLLATNRETVFILLTQVLFSPWIAGILLAAILAAVMSTIDSQLLVCSSAIANDFYQGLFRRQAKEFELVLVSRISVLIIAIVAIGIALNPDNQVLSLVSYAWGGCGASFGPVILISLFWQGTTFKGALAGMITGAITIILWKNLSGGIFELYELLPAFIFSSLAIWIVSLIDKSGQKRLYNNYQDFKREFVKESRVG